HPRRARSARDGGGDDRRHHLRLGDGAERRHRRGRCLLRIARPRRAGAARAAGLLRPGVRAARLARGDAGARGGGRLRAAYLFFQSATDFSRSETCCACGGCAIVLAAASAFSATVTAPLKSLFLASSTALARWFAKFGSSAIEASTQRAASSRQVSF